MVRFTLISCFLVGFISFADAQTDPSSFTKFTFRDTIHNLVFDSLRNDMGEVEPVNVNNQMVKHFIYLGDEPVFITSQKSGDPHFICDYPQEPIVRGKVYSFTVCFWFQNGRGHFNKQMMLELNNGKQIFFTFKGRYRHAN
ncbi:MAG: hypothetical protein ACKO5C_00405 [Ferruginibacter sp.]